MKLSNEVKIGLIGIVTLAVLIWGINYLKGRNILKSSYSLYTFFADSQGLESSAPVILKGIKVGYVDEVVLHTDQPLPVEVVLQLENSYRLREGTAAVLVSTDLLGTKAIRIEPSRTGGELQDRDTIRSMVELDMLASLQAQIVPAVERISDLAVSLDRLAGQLDTMVSGDATRATIQHLSEASGSLSRMLGDGSSLNLALRNMESFTAMLKEQEEELASLSGHLSSISASLDSAGIGNLAGELRVASRQISQILAQINSGEGSAGKFIYSDSLYLNLDLLVSDLDSLVRDLNENPQDYVHISLFGNSQKNKR